MAKTDLPSTPPRRGRPAKITRERLAAAASELGFADFKVAEVARRLDVTLQTLYNHVRDRDELLHLAAEVLEHGQAAPKDAGLSWQDWWRQWARTLLDLYRRNPGLATILMTRPLVNAPPLTDRWEAAQVIAERDGFSALEALWANMAVHEFVYAWASREDRSARPRSFPEPHALDDGFAQRFPRFAAAVVAADERPFDERFTMTLEALLAGLVQGRGPTP